jgi:hypothetical protein
MGAHDAGPVADWASRVKLEPRKRLGLENSGVVHNLTCARQRSDSSDFRNSILAPQPTAGGEMIIDFDHKTGQGFTP